MSTTFAEAVLARLAAHTGFNNLVAGRVSPLRLEPSPVYPAVVYQQISGQRDQTHDGVRGLDRIRMSFTCWADTYLVAKSVATQLKLALDGFQSADKNAGEIAGAEIVGEVDLLDNESARFRTVVDVMFWSRDTAA